MDFLIIGILILINGFFSLSEISLVTSRKSRLESAAKKGSTKAKLALDLAENPNKFLSTVQIGITVIGILTGIFGGQSIAEQLATYFAQFTSIADYAHGLAVGIVVTCITFLSIVFGELLPKRIGMTYPESIAKNTAGIMKIVSLVTAPFVWALTHFTDLFIKVFNIKATDESKVTEEEIKAIVQEGKEGGEVQEIEQNIVERVFMLGDRMVSTLMTPRNQVLMFEVNEPMIEVKPQVLEEMHSVYPVYEEDKDNLIGVIKLKELVANFDNPNAKLRSYVIEANYILEKTSAYQAMEKFKKSKIHYGIIIDEFGQMQGIVTLNDLLEALVGNVSEFYEEEFQLVEREDGTWMIDGLYPFPDFLHHFDLIHLQEELEYDTVGGLLYDEMERIPKEGDVLEWNEYIFEVMDMDGTRIDKILMKHKK